MRSKKIVGILASLGMILCVAACGGQAESPEAQWRPRENIDRENTETEPSVETSVSDQEETSKEDQEIQLLALENVLMTRYEWYGDMDRMLVRSEDSHIYLSQEGALLYPEMAKTLSQLAAMQGRAMEDEADNLIQMAKDELKDGTEGFETYVSTLDLQVRRADSRVLSLLADSYADYGQLEGYRGLHGCNYDTKTGQELKLSDVIIDMSRIPQIIERELNSHMWTGEFYSDTAVADYFRETPEDGIGWTLDYNGITFYFAPGTLCPAGFGSQTATVSFAEFPELFVERYREVPEEYMVRLAMNTSFFTDLDGDGVLDELLVGGNYEKEDRFYWDFGIYTDVDGYDYYQECFAYDFNPYYVKTAEGESYLYLFCEESEEYDRQMMLVVVALDKADFTRVGEMNVAPAYLLENRFAVPTDPAALYLDDFDEVFYGEAYAVRDDGMPERISGTSWQPKGEIEFDPINMELVTLDVKKLGDTGWKGYLLMDRVSGDSMELFGVHAGTDGSRVRVLLELESDGTGVLTFVDQRLGLTWQCGSEEYACLSMEDGRNFYLSLWALPGEENELLWIELQMEEIWAWCYQSR